MKLSESGLKAVALILLLSSGTNTLSYEGSHLHPIYTYSCNEDLSVTFKGVDGMIELFKSLQNHSTSCNISQDSQHQGNFRLSPDCMMIENGSSTNETIKQNRIAYISVYDKSEGEEIPTSQASVPITTKSQLSKQTSTTTAQRRRRKREDGIISSGHHIFKITCNAISEDGIERVALSETGIKDLDELPGRINEVGQVEMRFKEGQSMTLPDVSEVYVGDRFFMYLTYMGKTTDYNILPKICTAFKGTYRKLAENLELWNSTGGCVSQTAQDYDVMKNFVRVTGTQVYAEMHGFRFTSSLNVGEDDITIECKVLVCTQTQAEHCNDNCNITTVQQSSVNRHRRAVELLRLKTVSRTIKIRKNLNSAGKTLGYGVLFLPLIWCISRILIS